MSPKSAARRTAAVAVLLGVLGVIAAVTASAASGPVAPTISSGPGNPTNATTATFAFSGAGSVSYQCSRDGGAFAACTSGTLYSGFGAGSHSFRVRGVDNKGKTGDVATWSWLVDLVAPTLSSAGIVRLDPTPTKASPLRWTVTFSEPVTGVGTANFGAVTSNTTGTPTTASVTPAAGALSAAWTVSMTTTGMTGLNNGSLALKLQSATGIKDAATNNLSSAPPVVGQAYTFDTTPPLAPSIDSGPAASPAWTTSTSASFAFSIGGEPGATFLCRLDSGTYAACSSPQSYSGLSQGPHTFYVEAKDAAGNIGSPASRAWQVDTVPPPAPVLVIKPDDPNGDGLADFTWTITPPESPLTFTCQIENFAFQPCSSPFHTIVDVSNNQQHQFVVRAYDAAGNHSETSYRWKVDQSVRFTITGNAIGLLYPGGAAREIDLLLHNPNNFAIYVTSLQVTADSNPSCSAGYLTFQQTDVDSTPAKRVLVPANGTSHVPNLQRPKVTMVDSGTNQDSCKNSTFTLRYAGTATK